MPPSSTPPLPLSPFDRLSAELVDPSWDDSDVADFLTELDLADAARAEDAEW
nr:hypothetical protein [Brevundimonas diminuta]